MLRHVARLLHGLLAVGLLLGLAPPAHAAATYDVTQVGDAVFARVWDFTTKKEIKKGGTVAWHGFSPYITLHAYISDMSKLGVGDVVTIPVTSDKDSHYGMDSTSYWRSAEDITLSDGSTVVFKVDASSGPENLRLVRTDALVAGRFDFDLTIRSTNYWYSNRNATSSTWHVGRDDFGFLNDVPTNQRCLSDSSSVGAGTSESGSAGTSIIVWNCATVNRIANGGKESDSASDMTFHLHVQSTETGHPITITVGGRVNDAYLAYDERTAGSSFPGSGINGYHVPKRVDDAPGAGEYRLTANTDGSYDYDLNLGPREGPNAMRLRGTSDDPMTAALIKASGGLLQVSYGGGVKINFDSSTESRSAVVTWTSSEHPDGGTFFVGNTIMSNIGQAHAVIAYNGNHADAGAVNSTIGEAGESAQVADNGFTRKGYTFACWDTKPDGSGTVYKPGEEVAYPAEGRILTLYAQWRPITYKVRFDGNGAASGTMADLTATYDEKKTLPANRYARPGKAFAGWNTKADGSGAMYRNKAEATNLASSQDDVVVLYAQWEDAMTVMPETGGTVGDHGFGKTIGGGLVFWPSSRSCWRDGACAETGSSVRKGGVTC